MSSEKIIFIEAKGYPKAYLKFLNCDVFINTKTFKDTEVNKSFDINCDVVGRKMVNGIAASITTKSAGLEVVIVDNSMGVKGIFDIDKNFNNLEALISKAKKIFSKGLTGLDISYEEGKNIISKFGKTYVLAVNDLYDIDNLSKYEVVIDNLSEKNKIVHFEGKKMHITSKRHTKTSQDGSTIKLDPRIDKIGFIASDKYDFIFCIETMKVPSRETLLIINLVKLTDLTMLEMFGNEKFFDKIIAYMKPQNECYITKSDFVAILYDI